MSAEIVVVVPQPSREVDVHGVCQSIEAWAAQTLDMGALKHNKAKLAAIDTYLDQTSTDGRAQIAATMRRLEVRIGQLLGEAQVGTNQHSEGSSASEPSPLTPNERSQFRKMAENEDVVEEAIAASTDEKPASRASVISMIDRSPAAIAERRARAEGRGAEPTTDAEKLAAAMDDGGALELARWHKKFYAAVSDVTGVARNFTLDEIVANADTDALDHLQRSSDRIARLLIDISETKRKARQLRSIGGSK